MSRAVGDVVRLRDARHLAEWVRGKTGTVEGVHSTSVVYSVRIGDRVAVVREEEVVK